MPVFSYQARDSSGQQVSGTREATTQRDALEALREAGLFVTKLSPDANGRGNGKAAVTATANGAYPAGVVRGERSTPAIIRTEAGPVIVGNTKHEYPLRPLLRANSKQMSLYFRQMHAMLHAGTSLGHALVTMGDNAPNPALRRASQEMSVRIAQGQQWSEVMRTYPGLFSELMMGMIGAGEMGGFLERMCLRLSEYSERDYEIQTIIKRETWYPKLLIFCAFLIPSAVPLVTGLVGVSGQNPWVAWWNSIRVPVIGLGIILGVWKFKQYFAPLALHSKATRYWLDWLKLILPVAGKTVRALATAKFCRSLGALQSAGMAPHRSIAMAANACGNEVIAESARRVIRRVEEGYTFTDALESTKQFSGIAIQMMRTGEESGNIDEQLDKVADFLEQDAETTLRQSVMVLGIVIFFIVAIMIAIQVIQGYVKIYTGIIDEGTKE